MARLNNPKARQRECDEWNRLYPVGQKVRIRFDSGQTSVTTTRSPAELLSGHTPVVWLEGVAGCCLLSRVSAETGEGVNG